MKVINESQELNFGFSYAKNISKGGMALDTKILLDESIDIKKGDTLKLKFKIPGGRLYITVEGKVTRISKTEIGNCIIGLKFSSVDGEFKKEIEKFVEETKKGNLSLI